MVNRLEGRRFCRRRDLFRRISDGMFRGTAFVGRLVPVGGVILVVRHVVVGGVDDVQDYVASGIKIAGYLFKKTPDLVADRKSVV